MSSYPNSMYGYQLAFNFSDCMIGCLFTSFFAIRIKSDSGIYSQLCLKI